MATIYSILENTCHKFPDKTALIYQNNNRTYEEVLRKTSYIKTFFQSKCSTGDVVSLYMENSDTWILSYFGILGSGCVCNPIGLRTSDENIVHQLKFSDSKYIVCSTKLVDKLKKFSLPKNIKIITVDEILQGNNTVSSSPPAEVDENSYATLLYTSGTSSIPKAVRLKNKTVLTATHNIVKYLKLKSSDIYYQILPLSHSFGLGNVHSTFLVGGTVIISDNTINYKKIIAEMIHYKVTFLAAVPLTLRLIIENYIDEFLKLDDCLRVICTNTGPMPTKITHEIITKTKNIQFFTYYGLTEASRTTFMHYNMHSNKLHSVGKPVEGSIINIIDDKGDIIKKANITGEIYIKGDHVVTEYWKNEETTKSVFKEGWMHTGDIGYCDEEGFLYVIGRDDDIVNISGEKISLQKIDNVITELSFIKDAACLDKPDATREFVIDAYVVLDSEILTKNSKDEVRALIKLHCKKFLDTYATPQNIIFVDELPRTDSGKIKRSILRKLYSEKS